MADMIHGQMLNSPEDAYRAQAAATVAAMVRDEAAEPMILADTAASDRTVSSNAYRELIVTDLRPELANITVPTEVVYVAFDFPGMTPEMTDGIYSMSFATLPGVELTRIDEAAHFVFLDQPEAFNRELDVFLAE
ncbi:alpha/beta fold hydrolase [Brevundimonas aurifodinae]